MIVDALQADSLKMSHSFQNLIHACFVGCSIVLTGMFDVPVQFQIPKYLVINLAHAVRTINVSSCMYEFTRVVFMLVQKCSILLTCIPEVCSHCIAIELVPVGAPIYIYIYI